MRKKKVYFKYCNKCGRKFIPTSSGCKLCEDCVKEIEIKRVKKIKKSLKRKKSIDKKNKMRL